MTELLSIANEEVKKLRAALGRLVAWVDEEDDIREGALLDPFPSCNECTQGCTPINFDKGPCPYHQALAALNTQSGDK